MTSDSASSTGDAAGTTATEATTTAAATTETTSTQSTTEQTTGDGDAGFDYAIIFDHDAYLKTPNAADSPLGAGGMTIDPATLHLFLSDLESTCANPEPQWSCAANNYRLHLAIPPDAQVVGVHAIPAELVGRVYLACEADDCGCSQGEDWLMNSASLEFTTFDASVVAGEYCRGGACTPFSATRC